MLGFGQHLLLCLSALIKVILKCGFSQKMNQSINRNMSSGLWTGGGRKERDKSRKGAEERFRKPRDFVSPTPAVYSMAT